MRKGMATESNAIRRRACNPRLLPLTPQLSAPQPLTSAPRPSAPPLSPLSSSASPLTPAPHPSVLLSSAPLHLRCYLASHGSHRFSWTRDCFNSARFLGREREAVDDAPDWAWVPAVL